MLGMGITSTISPPPSKSGFSTRSKWRAHQTCGTVYVCVCVCVCVGVCVCMCVWVHMDVCKISGYSWSLEVPELSILSYSLGYHFYFVFSSSCISLSHHLNISEKYFELSLFSLCAGQDSSFSIWSWFIWRPISFMKYFRWNNWGAPNPTKMAISKKMK